MPAESAVNRHIDGSQQTRHIDARIAELAGRQFGLVSGRQLGELGLGVDGVEGRVRGGRLHRVHSGVYAVGHTVMPMRGRWLAAVLACGEDAVLSHRSAAALWGIRRDDSEATDVTTPRKWRPAPTIRRHCSHLPHDEVTRVDGIPVTIAPRTILDLASGSPAHIVESALREAEYLRLYDALSLPDLLDRHRGRRGVRAVRQALARCAESPGRTRSRLEERFLLLLDRYRLPRPQLNAWLEAGGRRQQVDCLWPTPRAIVELDGWQAHGTRRAFRDDRARDRRLRVAGYTVTRIAWSQLDEEPEALAADLRILLGLRQ